MKKIIMILAILFPGCFNVQAQSDSLPDNFYRHYTGTIAGQKVSANLWSINGRLGGRYEYKKYQKNIALSFLTQAYGVYLFGENVQSDSKEDKYPVWKVQFKANQLTGNWMRADKKKLYPIRLEESDPDGVMRFTYAYAHREIPAFPQQVKSGSSGITFIYPKALGNDVKARFINGEIKELLGFKKTMSFKAGMEMQYQKLATDYLKEAEEAKNSGDRDADPLEWFSIQQINITYNKNGYVQLRDFEQGYFGGAHPNHSEGNVIYDMKNERLLHLYDVTTMDSVQLQHLVEARFRKDHGMQPDDSLTKFLFKNYLLPTENFSFDRQGIQFIYNTYEVGPYSMGTIYVFIPYEQLKGTLAPEFEKRMHLFFEPAPVYRRKGKESAMNFANRLKPDSTSLIPSQVIETKEFGTDKDAILAFYRKTIYETRQMDTYVDRSQYDIIEGRLFLPVADSNYKEIKLDTLFPDGGDPQILSVFFANADHQPGSELVVLCKIPQRHYDYSGAFYETYFFHYDRQKQQFTVVGGLSDTFFGCECGFRDGRTEHAKYKTAAAIRKKLKAMGF